MPTGGFTLAEKAGNLGIVVLEDLTQQEDGSLDGWQLLQQDQERQRDRLRRIDAPLDSAMKTRNVADPRMGSEKRLSLTCHYLFRSCFATSLHEQEDKESIQRDKSDAPTQPCGHRWWSGGCDRDGSLSLTGTPSDDDIQEPLSPYRDLRGSLHATRHVRVWTETGSHRCRRHI